VDDRLPLTRQSAARPAATTIGMLRHMDHTTCDSDRHDRSSGPSSTSATLVCQDCNRLAFYCSNTDAYHHVEAGVECFLLPAWNRTPVTYECESCHTTLTTVTRTLPGGWFRTTQQFMTEDPEDAMHYITCSWMCLAILAYRGGDPIARPHTRHQS
jgi:hypothetical protein